MTGVQTCALPIYGTVVIDEAFPCVLICFFRLLFIVGEMEHGPLQGVPPVFDQKPDRLMIVGFPDYAFKIQVFHVITGKKAGFRNAAQVDDADMDGMSFALGDGQQPEPVIFRRIFQLQGKVVVGDPVAFHGLVGDMYVLASGDCFHQCLDRKSVV